MLNQGKTTVITYTGGPTDDYEWDAVNPNSSDEVDAKNDLAKISEQLKIEQEKLVAEEKKEKEREQRVKEHQQKNLLNGISIDQDYTAEKRVSLYEIKLPSTRLSISNKDYPGQTHAEGRSLIKPKSFPQMTDEEVKSFPRLTDQEAQDFVDQVKMGAAVSSVKVAVSGFSDYIEKKSMSTTSPVQEASRKAKQTRIFVNDQPIDVNASLIEYFAFDDIPKAAHRFILELYQKVIDTQKNNPQALESVCDQCYEQIVLQLDPLYQAVKEWKESKK